MGGGWGGVSRGGHHQDTSSWTLAPGGQVWELNFWSIPGLKSILKTQESGYLDPYIYI